MEFNKQLFSHLLGKAIADRSQNEFSIDSGVSTAYISKLMRGLIEKPPSPEVIHKFGAVARNGVSYYDLMRAAGHMGFVDNSNTAEIRQNTIAALELPYLEEEIMEWLNDPNNADYIRFIYKVSKSGIPKELLNKVKLLIDIGV